MVVPRLPRERAVGALHPDDATRTPPEPVPRSCRLHAGHHRASRQAPARLVPRQRLPSVSTRRQRFTGIQLRGSTWRSLAPHFLYGGSRPLQPDARIGAGTVRVAKHGKRPPGSRSVVAVSNASGPGAPFALVPRRPPVPWSHRSYPRAGAMGLSRRSANSARWSGTAAAAETLTSDSRATTGNPSRPSPYPYRRCRSHRTKLSSSITRKPRAPS